MVGLGAQRVHFWVLYLDTLNNIIGGRKSDDLLVPWTYSDNHQKINANTSLACILIIII